MQDKVFRIHNLELLDMLELERRKGYRYAVVEFRDNIGKLDESANQARGRDPSERDTFDIQAMALAEKLGVFSRFGQSHSYPPRLNSREDVDNLRRQHDSLMRFPLPHSVPPGVEGEEWQPFMHAVLLAMISPEPNPAINHLGALLNAYHNKDVEVFNEQLVQYREHLASVGSDSKRLSFEAQFNHFQPFYYSSVIYIVAMLLCIFAWIGWGCVLTGLLIEGLFKLGVGNFVASVAGFTTLLIAHFLAGDGDTLEMMQAVLDTKFWLSTHVIVINLGYMATLFAGLIAVVYIVRGVLTKSVDKDTEKSLGRTIYGVLCFGLLTSFVGTVLGGLWADDSWGRFWGWDPKENGALIIVLWNALILHARIGGMVKIRGMAILAVFGNICTAWSWWGVNQLGVGLHSYGFVDSVAFWLIIFVATQLVVMALGMIPKKSWRSVAGGSSSKNRADSKTTTSR